MSEEQKPNVPGKPMGTQFSLRQLMECVAWTTVGFAFVGYLFNREGRGSEDFEGIGLLLISPIIVLGCAGAAVGSLRSSRWGCLATGAIVGAIPLCLFVAFLLLMSFFN